MPTTDDTTALADVIDSARELAASNGHLLTAYLLDQAKSALIENTDDLDEKLKEAFLMAGKLGAAAR